jgi:uncharacterized protein YbcI
MWLAMADEAALNENEGELLGRVSRELVHALKRSYGKGPTKAKSYLCDDILLVAMEGGLLPAENTMIERGRNDLVREFRQQYENELAGTFTAVVEEITGRKVLNYQSQIMFDPDMIFELFVLDRDAGGAAATPAMD